jgi:hypothetical protein
VQKKKTTTTLPLYVQSGARLELPQTVLQPKKKRGAERKILADLVGCKDREEEGLEVERQVGATATATAPHHEHVWTYLIFKIELGAKFSDCTRGCTNHHLKLLSIAHYFMKEFILKRYI